MDHLAHLLGEFVFSYLMETALPLVLNERRQELNNEGYSLKQLLNNNGQTLALHRVSMDGPFLVFHIVREKSVTMLLIINIQKIKNTDVPFYYVILSMNSERTDEFKYQRRKPLKW